MPPDSLYTSDLWRLGGIFAQMGYEKRLLGLIQRKTAHAYAHAARRLQVPQPGVINGSSPASMEAECKMTLVDCVLCLLFLGRRMRGPYLGKGLHGCHTWNVLAEFFLFIFNSQRSISQFHFHELRYLEAGLCGDKLCQCQSHCWFFVVRRRRSQMLYSHLLNQHQSRHGKDCGCVL